MLKIFLIQKTFYKPSWSYENLHYFKCVTTGIGDYFTLNRKEKQKKSTKRR